MSYMSLQSSGYGWFRITHVGDLLLQDQYRQRLSIPSWLVGKVLTKRIDGIHRINPFRQSELNILVAFNPDCMDANVYSLKIENGTWRFANAGNKFHYVEPEVFGWRLNMDGEFRPYLKPGSRRAPLPPTLADVVQEEIDIRKKTQKSPDLDMSRLLNVVFQED